MFQGRGKLTEKEGRENGKGKRNKGRRGGREREIRERRIFGREMDRGKSGASEDMDGKSADESKAKWSIKPADKWIEGQDKRKGMESRG